MSADLCSAVHEALLEKYPDIENAFALINGGTCRSSLPVGPVTNEDIFNAWPFGSEIEVLKLPGHAIWEAFNRILESLEDDSFGNITMFQVSRNVRVTWSYAQVQQRLQSVEIDGRPLDDETVYNVITTDFVAIDGDSYFKVQNGWRGPSCGSMETALQKYIYRHSPITKYEVSDRVLELSGTRKVPSDSENKTKVEPQVDESSWDPDASTASKPYSRHLELVAMALTLSLVLQMA
jgi:2',3'-cyclic-nucleotide 2'-phosphodiesterase (5'-nucleotidase family)